MTFTCAFCGRTFSDGTVSPPLTSLLAHRLYFHEVEPTAAVRS